MTVDGEAKATVTAGSLDGGSVAVRGEYSGDHDFAPSSAALTQVVRSPSTVELSSAPNPSNFGQPVTFLVSVRSAAPGTATGTLKLGAGGTLIGETALDAGGRAGLTGISLPAGQHAVVVEYDGDPYFAPSSGGTTQVVERAPTTTTFRSSIASNGSKAG